MREVRIRPRAQLDIESTFIYIALENDAPKAARELVNRFYNAFDQLAEIPDMGRIVNDEELERDYRRMLVGNYWVYYTFDDSTLTIWRVFHTRQDIDNYSIVDF